MTHADHAKHGEGRVTGTMIPVLPFPQFRRRGRGDRFICKANGCHRIFMTPEGLIDHVMRHRGSCDGC